MSNPSLKYKLLLMIASVSLTACSHPQTQSNETPQANQIPYFESYSAAIIEPKLVRSSIAIEKQLNDRQGVPMPPGEESVKLVPGTQPIIITAPHSVRPFRNGKYRFSDGGATAAYAIALAELVGAHVIYANYENGTDPNYLDDNEFKRELAGLIEQVNPVLVLDIHGSNPMRSYDLDIGTMNGESLLGQEALVTDLIDTLAKEGIFSISYNRFSASKQQTIAKFASKRGVPTLQLEVNATYLMPSEGHIEAQRYAILLQAFSRYISNSVLSKPVE
ncbi:ketol-acid reductoisomerase [Marinomonas sp. S3726]|uniref:ketol-acid reductoisomerase n=1 Tax=Marinomonas sp. S3726 TaxID=579484 RepID=UPI0005FA4E34|nr:ketol-acid reductoisomerase [Marinomonas sp. S3726]KJZ13209.1 ketol-acid reductoisomerase [Marinomonas sp. S3726]